MVKTASWVFGVIFILAGILGFFASTGEVLGFLAANTASNIVHILAGVALLATAAKSGAAMTVKAVGGIYVILAILGFLSWTFMASSMATNWFYVVVGVVLAVIGFMGGKNGAAASATTGSAAPMGGSPQM